jgi:hypothetical protein
MSKQATFIKLIGDRGETLGYVNRETGECLWQEEAPGKVVQEFGSGRTNAMNAQREAKKQETRAVPATAVETVVAAITENVQLTKRAPIAFDEEV